MSLPRGARLALALAALTACGGHAARLAPETAPPRQPSPAAARDRTVVVGKEPALAPHIAYLAGLLPRREIGVDSFLVAHPTFDGRGVLIAILDSGLDPRLAGLQRTTTGARKVLDLRDFSGESRVSLLPIQPDGSGQVVIGGMRVRGFGRIAALSRGPYFGGVFDERRLAAMPAADANGNGEVGDRFPIVVARASDGWVLVTDTDADGTLDDERPVRDYALTYDTFTYHRPGRDAGPMTFAVNFADADADGDAPDVSLVMDNSSHGSHVAGIAAGHDLFGVEGFDGIAPGAQLLGLKIANNARGGTSVTGSMARAMVYAADFAERRGMPLVLNLSYGVGNAVEGAATIDSITDAFAAAHPAVLLVVSAGNDGPGLSTMGLPGTAADAMTVCALFPGVFAWDPATRNDPPPDVLGWWSARGGEVAKPDVCAPGIAYSNVPPWRTGEEVSGGTSMAAPQIAGAAAILQSALLAVGMPPARGVELKRALMVSARRLGGTTVLDEGAGVPNVSRAFRWLRSIHQTGIYDVAALPDGGNSSRGPAAYRRRGLASPADTIQRFTIQSVEGQPTARFELESDASWLHAPRLLEMSGGPAEITVTYDAAELREPGMYVGTVWARAASDTAAGAAFQLTNTIVVPYDLSTPLVAHGMLTPGAIARYFVDVPEDAGGMTVELRVPRVGPDATAYVYEPSGQPYRGGSRIAAGGENPKSASASVAAEDLVPGVYEIVVVAPPADPVGYELSVELPPVAVTAVEPDRTVQLRSRSAQAVEVPIEAAVVGVVRDTVFDGRGSVPVVLRTRVPKWASELTVDVELPTALWDRLTDFAVTVYDSAGMRVSDGPLNYPFGRQSIPIENAYRGTSLSVELVPAFALPTDAPIWRGRARLLYLTPQADTLAPLDPTGDETGRLVPGERRMVRLDSSAVSFPIPPGFEPLLEVRAGADSGARSVRRARVIR